MFCSSCGKEIKEAKFCPYCGEKQDNIEVIKNQPESDSDAPKSSDKSKGNAKKVVLLSIGTVAVVICGIAFLVLKPSKSEKFLNMLKKGEYTEATVYYQSDLAGNEKEVQKVYATVTAEINSLVESYYADAMSYADAKNGLNAYSDFYSTETQKALKDIEKLKASKDAFALAEEQFRNEKYREAYKAYSEVIEQDSNFSASKSKLEECYNFVREQIWANSENLASEGDMLAAADILGNELYFLNEEDVAIANTKIEEYKNQYLSHNISTFNALLTEANYDECFSMIDTLTTNVGNTEEIQKATNELYAKFENYITEQVNLYLEERDLVTCMQWIRQGQEQLPFSQTFADLENMLLEYMPIPLVDVYEYEDELDGYIESEKYQRDTYQNEYTDAMQYRLGSYADGGHIVYLLNEEYQHFSTILAPSEDYESTKTVAITIYGDDVKLYEAKLTKDSKPIAIELDVTGIEKLKIEFEKDYYAYAYVLFGEPNLYKKF